MTRQADPRIRVKSVKAWAFYRAPFERFVYLDFDSSPVPGMLRREVLAKLAQTITVVKTFRAESSCHNHRRDGPRKPRSPVRSTRPVRAPLGRGRVPRDECHGGGSQVFCGRVRAHEAATGPARAHGRLALGEGPRGLHA